VITRPHDVYIAVILVISGICMTFPKRGDEFEAEGAWTIRDPGIMDHG
jgi:hypothetical protein